VVSCEHGNEFWDSIKSGKISCPAVPLLPSHDVLMVLHFPKNRYPEFPVSLQANFEKNSKSMPRSLLFVSFTADYSE
jgi:hypothetical protein